LPVAGVRFGRLTGTHIAVDVGGHTPAPAPGPLVKVYMGFAEKTGRNVLRVGFEEGGLMVSGRTLNEDGFEFEPYLSLGGSSQYQVGVGFKKRFYRKTKP
jgi:hypothetical protein